MEVWVDANVVLRLLTGEPELMAAAAQRIVERAETGELTLKLSTIVVAEIVWVLGSFYEVSKPRIAELLTVLAMADGFDTEECDLVVAALQTMAEKNVDFIDAFLAERARATGQMVVSFEGDFKKLGIEHLSPSEEISR